MRRNFAVILIFGVLAFLCPELAAQYEDGPKTIRFKKETDLAKAKFDNTGPRLFVIDRYGNVRENRIGSYKLYVKTKRGVKAFDGFSNELTPEMITFLGKQKEAVKIFFTEIKAIDEGEHLVPLPDVIEVWFPECRSMRR